jgi:hypothetical protein
MAEGFIPISENWKIYDVNESTKNGPGYEYTYDSEGKKVVLVRIPEIIKPEIIVSKTSIDIEEKEGIRLMALAHEKNRQFNKHALDNIGVKPVAQPDFVGSHGEKIHRLSAESEGVASQMPQFTASSPSLPGTLPSLAGLHVHYPLVLSTSMPHAMPIPDPLDFAERKTRRLAAERQVTETRRLYEQQLISQRFPGEKSRRLSVEVDRTSLPPLYRSPTPAAFALRKRHKSPIQKAREMVHDSLMGHPVKKLPKKRGHKLPAPVESRTQYPAETNGGHALGWHRNLTGRNGRLPAL